MSFRTDRLHVSFGVAGHVAVFHPFFFRSTVGLHASSNPLCSPVAGSTGKSAGPSAGQGWPDQGFKHGMPSAGGFRLPLLLSQGTAKLPCDDGASMRYSGSPWTGTAVVKRW